MRLGKKVKSAWPVGKLGFGYFRVGIATLKCCAKKAVKINVRQIETRLFVGFRQDVVNGALGGCIGTRLNKAQSMECLDVIVSRY